MEKQTIGFDEDDENQTATYKLEEETKDLVNPYDKRKEKKSTADQNTNIITDYFKSKEDSGEKEQKQSYGQWIMSSVGYTRK